MFCAIHNLVVSYFDNFTTYELEVDEYVRIAQAIYTKSIGVRSILMQIGIGSDKARHIENELLAKAYLLPVYLNQGMA